MPCLLALIALAFPRIVIVLLVIFSDYIGNAYNTTIWPLLGFFFAPYTTLAYAWSMHANNGSVSGLYLIVVILAVLADIGSLGGGGAAGSRKRTVVVRRR